MTILTYRGMGGQTGPDISSHVIKKGEKKRKILCDYNSKYCEIAMSLQLTTKCRGCTSVCRVTGILYSNNILLRMTRHFRLTFT